MYKEQNDWYLISHGFRPHNGYYFHYDRKIIISEKVVTDFEPEKLKLHVEVADETHVTFLLSARPVVGIPEEIMKNLGWEGKKEVKVLK